MYTTIFLKENEKDIFQALKSQGIKTKVFEHRLAELFNRVYNNYVGYYVFKQDNEVYKMIVLPKTIAQPHTKEQEIRAEKEFVDYLLHYYRIKNIHPKLNKEKNIPKSLLQLAFESNQSKDKSHDFLEEFQSHRYMSILQDIEEFFKRHKNSKRIKQDYVSQSIKYKLNIKRNIKELDKTKIHQTQSKDMVFSLLATVTYYALKLFLVQKYSATHGDRLFKKVKKVQSILLKKYKIERGYKLSTATLQSLKLVKLFGKTEENRQLLVDIKSLFGFEQMYKDNTVSIGYRQDMTTTSLFINPSNFYEWYVYDILKKYADTNGKTIAFDKQEGTATKYKLNEELKSSNPDYILTDDESGIEIVIDAKWKNVNEFGDIKPSDYLKLKFDTSLLEKKGYGVVPYLVYPNITIEEKKFNMVLDESSIFKFNTLEIDMEFEKYGNSLAFDFDVQKLHETIEEESQIEEYKSMAETLSNELETQRTTILSQLMDEEDNERKDELKEELDYELQILGLKLSETLEEQELLPDIAEILKEYNDVLEDESKKFLQSSSAIYSYYKDKQYEHFDYSMPGSGFWKLIELELNTSFVWHIRIESRVCNHSCPWTNISIPNQKVSHRIVGSSNVVLNKSEIDNELRLQGIMLGNIKSLALDENTLNQFFRSYFSSNEISKRFIENDLVQFIEKISKLRNEHAHIKAMSLEKFEELWDVLFHEENDSLSLLKKLLNFKKSIKAQYDK